MDLSITAAMSQLRQRRETEIQFTRSAIGRARRLEPSVERGRKLQLLVHMAIHIQDVDLIA